MNNLEAEDEIFNVVASKWATIVTPVMPSNELRYYGLKYNTGVPVTKFWGRLSLQTVSEDQDTLRNVVRRFRSDGLVFLQLFMPTDHPQGARKLKQLSGELRDLFRHCTAADNVQFSRARVVDNIEPEAAWLKANVVAEFEYNQFV